MIEGSLHIALFKNQIKKVISREKVVSIKLKEKYKEKILYMWRGGSLTLLEGFSAQDTP